MSLWIPACWKGYRSELSIARFAMRWTAWPPSTVRAGRLANLSCQPAGWGAERGWITSASGDRGQSSPRKAVVTALLFVLA